MFSFLCVRTEWCVHKLTDRVVLNYGGNDVTTALCHLLERAAFPYKELDLARPQDWILMDDLKAKICTLEEVGIRNSLSVKVVADP